MFQTFYFTYVIIFAERSHKEQMLSEKSENKKGCYPLPETGSLIYVGAYGSGKSEISVNSALSLADCYEDVILADVDVINPFFRSMDAEKILSEHGVRVIAPRFANTNVDVPAVPQELSAVFDQKDTKSVLDIGGEDMGIRIVSTLKKKLKNLPYELIMVINMNRPFTADREGIIKVLNELETAAGVKVTGLVNNTNLLENTTVEDVLNSNLVISDVADEKGIPFYFAAVMEDLLPSGTGDRLPDGIPILRIKRTIFYG